MAKAKLVEIAVMIRTAEEIEVRKLHCLKRDWDKMRLRERADYVSRHFSDLFDFDWEETGKIIEQ